MITSIKAFKESILVPRNLDNRADKLKQKNYQFLQQEIIEGNLNIDKNWIFDNPSIKCKIITGDVHLYDMENIPAWLENVEIYGKFICSWNKLTTLKGCPKKIRGSFSCSNNLLKSLEFGPTEVGGEYLCSRNHLTELKYIPENIYGDFNCSNNKLTSLKGCPKYVRGEFDCSNNKLESPAFGPEQVDGDYCCWDNDEFFDKNKIQVYTDIEGKIYN